MENKRRLAVTAVILAAFGVSAQQRPPTAVDLEVLQIQLNLYMIAGAGGNIAVQIGQDAS